MQHTSDSIPSHASQPLANSKPTGILWRSNGLSGGRRCCFATGIGAKILPEENSAAAVLRSQTVVRGRHQRRVRQLAVGGGWGGCGICHQCRDCNACRQIKSVWGILGKGGGLGGGREARAWESNERELKSGRPLPGTGVGPRPTPRLPQLHAHLPTTTKGSGSIRLRARRQASMYAGETQGMPHCCAFLVLYVSFSGWNTTTWVA